MLVPTYPPNLPITARKDEIVAALRANRVVVIAGETGSGKTTTLYTTLKALATSEVNVCTVEDPIEMVEGAFNQMQVQHGIVQPAGGDEPLDLLLQ